MRQSVIALWSPRNWRTWLTCRSPFTSTWRSVVAQYEKRQVCVLVKAQPQPSQKYEETVCVAAVTIDHRLVRLYPVRFRHLDAAKRFSRFDWLDVEVTRATDDPRPE